MDFKKFYFSPEGRVNRKQWWLWLVLPLTVIGILLGLVDMATGNFHQKAGIGIGLFTGIFALLALIPAIIVYIKRMSGDNSATATNIHDERRPWTRMDRLSRHGVRLASLNLSPANRTGLAPRFP